eukprot:TRINITY_DN3230_c0_g1_i2.p1 TRINITY_DN3230_c0_g1~~TRINITY_DN3230_c0_g1_i2.p1  ORF type:complete len:93 (+),score=5.01 TRINITY_DN3230_c0_g1_i2:853-1131(+)
MVVEGGFRLFFNPNRVILFQGCTLPQYVFIQLIDYFWINRFNLYLLHYLLTFSNVNFRFKMSFVIGNIAFLGMKFLNKIHSNVLRSRIKLIT